MLLDYIKRHIDHLSLKEEFKKIGVNLITAGLVGVFITHQIGTSTLASIASCVFLVGVGTACLYLGIRKEEI
jgi:hypothetical protein